MKQSIRHNISDIIAMLYSLFLMIVFMVLRMLGQITSGCYDPVHVVLMYFFGLTALIIYIKTESNKIRRHQRRSKRIAETISEEREYHKKASSHVVLGIESSRHFGMSERPMGFIPGGFAESYIKSYKGVKHRGKSQPSAIDSLVQDVFSLEFNPSNEFEEYLTPDDFDIITTLLLPVHKFLRNKALDFKMETLDTEDN